MPKRKINLKDVTLAEAFAVIEREGLHVQVTGVQEDGPPPVPLDSIMEVAPTKKELYYKARPKKVVDQAKQTMFIDLYSSHSVSCGGVLVDVGLSTQRIESSGVQTYGPGKHCEVPLALAQHLLHQDAIARHIHNKTFDGKFRSYIAGEVQLPSGERRYISKMVSEDSAFDMSSALGQLGSHMQYFDSPMLLKL